MIIVVYCHTDTTRHGKNMGLPDYSYRFVLDRFRPVLEEFAAVTEVVEPDTEIDAIYEFGQAIDQPVVYLSFAPPHRTQLNLVCPTIPVFAWEFDDLPYETFTGDPAEDWTGVLGEAGRCITHSTHTANAVRAALGEDFPVLAVPAPLPDHFVTDPPIFPPPELNMTVIGRITDNKQASSKDGSIKGEIIKGQAKGSVNLGDLALRPAEDAPPRGPEPETRLKADGIIYTSIFNAADGRKNWRDMVNAFCVALRDKNATLILKVSGSQAHRFHAELVNLIERHEPMQCRVLAVDAYLDEHQFLMLARASHYAVNTSHGEGQCLPLMEYMALGRPAVAPMHTGMLDYLDEATGFPYETSSEPACWPQDHRKKIRTSRQRNHMDSLIEAFSESYRVATEDPKRFEEMGRAAAKRMRHWAGRDRIRQLLMEFLSVTETLKG